MGRRPEAPPAEFLDAPRPRAVLRHPPRDPPRLCDYSQHLSIRSVIRSIDEALAITICSVIRNMFAPFCYCYCHCCCRRCCHCYWGDYPTSLGDPTPQILLPRLLLQDPLLPRFRGPSRGSRGVGSQFTAIYRISAFHL